MATDFKAAAEAVLNRVVTSEPRVSCWRASPQRGKAWCSSSYASALFRAFYPCEYALRPDREDIIR